MNYEEYMLSLKEWAISIAIYVVADSLIAFFFYRSFIVFIGLLPGYYFFLKEYKKRLISKRKKQLLDEFSEVLLSVSLNMKSGHSIENAFVEAYKDIKLFYGDKSLMAEEIMRIRKGLEINITLEELIDDLAKRSEEIEIRMFSDVCKSAKRNGGNITEVLLNTAEKIRAGINTDMEIETLIAEKKLELRIMEAVPFFLMAYLEVTSTGYFSPLYKGLPGRLVMTACLLVYILAVLVGNWIMDIEV